MSARTCGRNSLNGGPEALLVLQLFVTSHGSIPSTRRIVGQIIWQIKELGLHRKRTAAAYPSVDNVELLLFFAMSSDKCV